MAKTPAPAAAPNPATIEQAAPPNRFLAHFPIERIRFKDNVRNPDKPWDDGTVSQTLANAIIELGTTKSYIPGARIVVKSFTNGRGKAFDLQLPSSGQQFRHPMLETSEDEDAKLDYEAWKKLVVAEWMAYRKRQVAAGASTIKGLTPTVGVTASDDMLKDLGVFMDPPKPAPATEEPPTT